MVKFLTATLLTFHAPMFEEAVRRAGTREMVMVGDQLATDILGAQSSGIHSALLDEGLARAASHGWPQEIAPNYLLASLELDASST